MANKRVIGDRVLEPGTLQWYLDFLGGSIQFKSVIEVEQTHDTIMNMILADLKDHKQFVCANIYSDAMRVAKCSYLAKFPDSEDLAVFDDVGWIAGVG